MARVLGTGGAARAIAAALADAGLHIVLAGRDPGKARALFDEIDPVGEHPRSTAHSPRRPISRATTAPAAST